MEQIKHEEIIKELKKRLAQDRTYKITKRAIRQEFNLTKDETDRIYTEFKEPVKPKINLDESSEVTDQERIFCLEYLKSYNLKHSSVKAGYSPREGSSLIKKKHIQDCLRKYQTQREEELHLSTMSIMRHYMEIAFADITDFVEFGTEEVILRDDYGREIKDKKGKVLTRKVNYIRLKNSSEVDGRLIQEVKQGKGGLSIKLQDKMKALEWLSNHMNMITEEERVRIELLKAKLEKDDKDETADDGFLAALEGRVDDIWLEE